MFDHTWDFVGHKQTLVGQCPMTDCYLKPCIGCLLNRNSDILLLLYYLCGQMPGGCPGEGWSRLELTDISRGGHPVYSWVGVCRWEFEALTLYQTMFSWFLQPYTKLDTENPYPIPDLHLLELYHYQCFNGKPSVNIDAAMILFTFRKASFSSKFLDYICHRRSVSRQMLPFSRPKLSDFYTISQTKLLENHTLHSGTYLYSSCMGVPPPRVIYYPTWYASDYPYRIPLFLNRGLYTQTALMKWTSQSENWMHN